MADIAKLQERGDAEKKFILRNDEEKVWAWLNGSGKGGVDFVLDNGAPRPRPSFVRASKASC